jgi:hypothetical protein
MRAVCDKPEQLRRLFRTDRALVSNILAEPVERAEQLGTSASSRLPLRHRLLPGRGFARSASNQRAVSTSDVMTSAL